MKSAKVSLKLCFLVYVVGNWQTRSVKSSQAGSMTLCRHVGLKMRSSCLKMAAPLRRCTKEEQSTIILFLWNEG